MHAGERRSEQATAAAEGATTNEATSVAGSSESADHLVLHLVELVAGMREQLDRVERRVGLGVVKEAYTTEEAAERLGRSEWTVRQWCNKGQVRARKVRGRGRVGEWRIAHDELVRVRTEGPLPAGTAAQATVA